jgi:membrane-associated protease RseP (regulator of RpoE activity)
MNRSTTLISIHKTNMNDLLIETGVYVAALKPNTEANECLDIGDRIISINGIKLSNKSLIEIIHLIRELHAKKEDFNLVVLKTSPINLNDLNCDDSQPSQSRLNLSPKLATGSSLILEEAQRKHKNRLSMVSDNSSLRRDKISLTSSILSNNRLNLDCLSSASTLSNSKGGKRHSNHFERIFSSKDKIKPLFKNFNTSGTSNDDVSFTSNNSLKYHHNNYYQQIFLNNNNNDEEYAVRELDDLIEDIQKQQQLEDLQEYERYSRVSGGKIKTTSTKHHHPHTHQQKQIGTWPKSFQRNEATTTTVLSDENSAYQLNHSTISGGSGVSHSSTRRTIFNNNLFNIENKDLKYEFDENEENFHHKMFLSSRNSKMIDNTSLSQQRPFNFEFDNKEVKLPSAGEIRNINIEKNNDVLGININENASGGGVYVSNVINNSLASNVGLHVGDQLLEINGVNLRKAGYKEAAKILTDCGSHNNVINLIVQYNPAKYFNNNKNLIETNIIPSLVSTITKTTTTPNHPSRCILLKRSLSKLGLQITGGNQTGIFIDSISSDCSLQKGDQILEWNNQDIRNFTLEKAVFEIYTKKITNNNNIKINVQLNQKIYEKINREEGDSFYLICLNDREKRIDVELNLKKFDILHVVSTLPNSYPDGYWKANIIYSTKQQKSSGLIPSIKTFIEELKEQQHDNSQASGTVQNEESTSLNSSISSSSPSSSSKLKKLFKNKQKSSSQLTSNSTSSFNEQFIDLSSIIKSIGNEELRQQQPLTYKLVQSNDVNLKRPCLIIGELSDLLSDYIVELNSQLKNETIKLTKINRQTTDKMNYSSDSKMDFNEIDFGLYDYISLNELKDCLFKLNSFAFIKLKNIENIKELKEKHKIYPIVIYLKFKSFKQLKTISNSLTSAAGEFKKINNKIAKELFQNTSKLEKEYKSYITNYCDLGQLQNDSNTSSSSSSNNTDNNNNNTSFVDLDLLKQIYEIIKSIISYEKNRIIWIPASNTQNNNIFL